MPNNPPSDAQGQTPSGGADTLATEADATQVERKADKRDPLEKRTDELNDITVDGGGQRSEVGAPYNDEGGVRRGYRDEVQENEPSRH